MISNFDDLLTREIRWRRGAESGVWIASVEGDACLLTMNDFPDEPLFTVRWQLVDKNIDDLPPAWTLDYGDYAPG